MSLINRVTNVLPFAYQFVFLVAGAILFFASTEIHIKGIGVMLLAFAALFWYLQKIEKMIIEKAKERV